MTKGSQNFIKGFAHKRALRRWRDAAANAATIELSRLRQQRNVARDLRGHLNDLIQTAEGRLALPRVGSTAFPRPSGTSWNWRPAIWRGEIPEKGIVSVKSRTRLGKEVSIFHDCTAAELTLRQLRNTNEDDLAPFGVRLDVFHFAGNFLSLVLDLPASAVEGLGKKHIIRIASIIEAERPIEVFVRLNIKNGPNTEQMVQELPLAHENCMVEFDLAYADINERRIESLWVDLIFENPEMNQLTIRDLTFCRYPRAEV